MRSRCDDLHPYLDDLLTPKQAKRWRDHVVDCDQCQAELHRVMQLKAQEARDAHPQCERRQGSHTGGAS